MSEVIETTFCASGAGGQHRNRKKTAIRLRHVPTGITVTCSRERSQHQNRRVAWRELRRRLEILNRPKKKRIGTKPTKASVERRISGKKRNAEKKAGRKKGVGYV